MTRHRSAPPALLLPLCALVALSTGCPDPDGSGDDTGGVEACVDADGDLYANLECADVPDDMSGLDCDDTRQDRNPGINELGNPALWYDGIDQDCDGQDILDRDFDGFPGILQADWVAQHDGIAWDDSLQPELDCDDRDAEVYPGAARDFPYDGVDTDCLGGEWDADGDGYVLVLDCMPPGALAYDGPLPQTDCDDRDASVNPGAASDPFYDGVDQDCDYANDFDQDGDFYIQDQHRPAYQAFVSTCGQVDDARDGDDCDDTDPTINPGALELLGDEVDQDCDLGNDTPRVQVYSYLWTDPIGPIVGSTPTDYVLAMVAGKLTFEGATMANFEAGSVFVFPHGGAPDGPAQKVDFEGPFNQWPLHDLVGFAPRADGWLALSAHERAGKTFLRMKIVNGSGAAYQAPLQDEVAFHDAFTLSPLTDADMAIDMVTDRYWAAACGDDSVQFLVATSNGEGLALVDGAQADVQGGRTCFLEPVSADVMHLHVYDGDGTAGHRVFSLDVRGPALDDGEIGLVCSSDAAGCDATDDYAVTEVNQRGSLTVFAGSDQSQAAPMGVTVWDQGALLGEYLTSYEVRSADAWLHDGVLHLVIVHGDGGENALRYAWGDPAGTLTELALPITHPTLTLTPRQASIYADDDRVFIGVSATGDTIPDGDAVGWMFLGL